MKEPKVEIELKPVMQEDIETHLNTVQIKIW